MMKVSTPLFQLKVLVNGQPIQEYRKDSRTYVEGRAGSRFELELTNLTGARILVHPNIDGISAMTGKDASRRDHSAGYVLGPHERAVIPGWRLNDRDVAEFFFAGAGKSYAEGTGRGKKNRGVIACTVWQEKVYPVLRTCFHHAVDVEPSPWETISCNAGAAYSSECCDRSPTKSATIGSPLRSSRRRKAQQNLGAGFGDRVDHQVRGTTFEVATEQPAAAAIIYYDDLDGLRSKGLRISSRRRHHEHTPDPFPQDTGCPPPRGWAR